MNIAFRLIVFASAALPSLGSSGGVAAQQPDMTFFVTSVGPGRGADLGGLAGADAHRRRPAAAVGAGSKTWRLPRHQCRRRLPLRSRSMRR